MVRLFQSLWLKLAQICLIGLWMVGFTGCFFASEGGFGGSVVGTNNNNQNSQPFAFSYYNPSPIYSLNQTISPNPPLYGGHVDYFISTGLPLPQGLSLDPETGVISGTPTQVVDPPNTFIITAVGSQQSVSYQLVLGVLPRYVVNAAGDGIDVALGDGICATGDDPPVCTLQAAIEQANASAGTQIIEISISDLGTLNPPGGRYVITQNLVIRGTHPTQESRMSSPTGLFEVSSNNVNVFELDRLKLVGAAVNTADGGALRSLLGVGEYRAIEIENCIFEGNRAINGGAISLSTAAGTPGSGTGFHRVFIRNSLFVNNQTYPGGRGGALALDLAVENATAPYLVEIEKSSFVSNVADQAGGAISVRGSTLAGENANRITIDRSIFEDNSATFGSGGALTIGDTSSSHPKIHIGSSLFSNNKSQGAAALQIYSARDITVGSSTFHQNIQNDGGSGATALMRLRSLSFTALANNVISENRSDRSSAAAIDLITLGGGPLASHYVYNNTFGSNTFVAPSSVGVFHRLLYLLEPAALASISNNLISQSSPVADTLVCDAIAGSSFTSLGGNTTNASTVCYPSLGPAYAPDYTSTSLDLSSNAPTPISASPLVGSSHYRLPLGTLVPDAESHNVDSGNIDICSLLVVDQFGRARNDTTTGLCDRGAIEIQK